jgi:DNA invertase Pin-like site-specific DNA recombinase
VAIHDVRLLEDFE